MKRIIGNAFGIMIATAGIQTALAGEASTDASATSGWGNQGGTAQANASWDGDGGRGLTRTDTRTGRVNLARGLAVGIDRDGLDLSFSHAIAGNRGPGYAGTFNLSIGRDGSVSHSYGGAVSRGGYRRSVEAGGAASSRPGGIALASAGGRTWGGGIVQARTRSQHRPAYRHRLRRPVRFVRGWRR